MPLFDYTVARDRFEPDESASGLSFPCSACRHRVGSDREEPCNSCDFNLNAGLPAEAQEVMR